VIERGFSLSDDSIEPFLTACCPPDMQIDVTATAASDGVGRLAQKLTSAA
jgi:hypothetical protein